MNYQVRTPRGRILPVEIWLAIGSGSDLTLGQLNSLSRTCGSLCTILRPILYKKLFLCDGQSGESALATLRLLTRDPPQSEGSQLAQHVRTFIPPYFEDYTGGLAKLPYQATWRALERMSSLEDIYFVYPPFDDQSGRDQFLAALKMSGACRRRFSVASVEGWCGYPEPADELCLQGLKNMVCSIEGIVEGDSTSLHS
jgi:hypothetical protein